MARRTTGVLLGVISCLLLMRGVATLDDALVITSMVAASLSLVVLFLP